MWRQNHLSKFSWPIFTWLSSQYCMFCLITSCESFLLSNLMNLICAPHHLRPVFQSHQNCALELSLWRSLLNGQSALCLYQTLLYPSTIWIVLMSESWVTHPLCLPQLSRCYQAKKICPCLGSILRAFREVRSFFYPDFIFECCRMISLFICYFYPKMQTRQVGSSIRTFFRCLIWTNCSDRSY